MAFQREPWLVASQTPDVWAAPAVSEAEQSEAVSSALAGCLKSSVELQEAKLPPLGK